LFLVGNPSSNIESTVAGVVDLYDARGRLVRSFENPTPEPGDNFGHVIDMLAGKVIVGARSDSEAETVAGAVYLFAPDGQLLHVFTSPHPVFGGQFGQSVAAVGHKILIGAPFDGMGSLLERPGAAYLFGAAVPLVGPFVGVEFTFTDPSADGTSTITFDEGDPVTVEVFAIMNETEKREAIADALEAAGYSVERRGHDRLAVNGLSVGTTVEFHPGDTGEARDLMRAESRVSNATIEWNGEFTAHAAAGEPDIESSFVMGVLTGPETAFEVQLSSGQIPGDLSGDSIAAALFDALSNAHDFPSDHVSLTLNGSMVEFEFTADLEGNGIIFGTTATSSGEGLIVRATFVPEPTSLGLCVGAVLMIGWRRPVKRCGRCPDQDRQLEIGHYG
jgi:hypothetical protein